MQCSPVPWGEGRGSPGETEAGSRPQVELLPEPQWLPIARAQQLWGACASVGGGEGAAY